MNFFEWFYTGSHGPYMRGWDCIMNDAFWGWANISLCILVIIGYLIIAYHWYSNLTMLKKGLAKQSLFNMVNIFLFCGICGYFFPIIKMWYPIWKLNAIFLLILNYFTWSYALNTPRLKVVYHELHEGTKLTEKVEQNKREKLEMLQKVKNDLQVPIKKISDTVGIGINDDTDPKITTAVAEMRKNALIAEEEINKLIKMLDEQE